MSTTTTPAIEIKSRKERRKAAEPKPANQQCSQCEHIGTDVQADTSDPSALLCAACRAPDDNPDTIPAPITPPSPEPTPATPQPTPSAAAVSKAQESLWDEAIATDNAVEFGVTSSAVHIGELVLRSFDLIRPGLAVGRETRDQYGRLLTSFGNYYANATKRNPQTSRWVNAYLAFSMASDAVKPLILGSASAPFACDTLVALAQDAHDHDPTVKSRRGLVALDNDTMQWVLEDNTDEGQTVYDQLIRDIVEKGYTAEAVRKEVKAIKRRALAGRETQAQKEERERADKVDRQASRDDRKAKIVKSLVTLRNDLEKEGMPLGKPELTSTLLGANLIINPKGYDPNNLTPDDAKQFAMELVASCNIEAMAIIHQALTDHFAALDANKQPSKRATATVNDAPNAPQPDDNPVSAAA
jgi:hypothetical protein